MIAYDPRDPEQRAKLVRALDAARERLLGPRRGRAGQGEQLQLGHEPEGSDTE